LANLLTEYSNYGSRKLDSLLVSFALIV